MKPTGNQPGTRWLATPANQAQAELRAALDQAIAREADEVALRRVWSKLSEIDELVPSAAAETAQAAARAGQGGIDGTRRVRWPWIVAASLAGATATLALMLVERRSDHWGGTARTETAGAQPVPVVSGAKREPREPNDQRSTLVAPATVRTGFGETLHLSLRGGAEAIVTSESVLILDEKDRPSVSAGEVQFHVPPQGPGRIFAVTAGGYRVVVVGTRFQVRVNEPVNDKAAATGVQGQGGVRGGVRVGVSEGIVEIWAERGSKVARIAAGESWTSPVTVRSPQVGAQVRRPPEAATTSTVTRARPDSIRALTGKTSRTVAISSAPAKASLGFEAKESSSVLGGVGAGAGISSAAAPASATTTARATEQPAPVVDSPVVVVPSVSSPPASPSETTPLALQARAARAAGDPRRALGLYRILAQRGGAAGENAEYEIGRVLRDNLDQPREAVAAWRAYRAEHPRGLLRVESDLSVIETLVSVGDKAGAAAEAADFIRRYPESERRLEVARLAGDLLRERGDCSGAVNAYDVALATGRARRESAGRLTDGISFHRSACLMRDDAGEGVAALKAYLQSFPGGRFRGEAQRLLAGASPAGAPPPVSRP